jgi:4-amino-4-deoxy-L-arabinose transferase-like glycosyltransferase
VSAALSGRIKYYLLIILLIAVFTRIIIPPFHLMYTDEFDYILAAKNILLNGHPGEYFRPIGWPFILSIIFRFSGVNNWVALYASIIFGVLTIVIIFFLGFILSRDYRIGLIASLFFALLPYHIVWSRSAETNAFSIFLITLIMLFYFLYIQYRTQPLLWLFLLNVSFATQVRI